MADLPTLETPRLRLRGLQEADVPALHACYGDAESMRYWDSPPSADLAETTARLRQSTTADPQWHATFAVTLRDDDRMIGMVNYHGRQPAARRLAVGWIVATPWRRQGFTHEAMTALLAHCFQALGTHRIEARIEPENIPSASLAQRLGFVPEGLMRDWTFVGGQPRSVVLYARLRRPE